MIPNEYFYIGNLTVRNNSEYSMDLSLKYFGDNSFIKKEENTVLGIGNEIFLIFSPDKDNPHSEGHFKFSDLELSSELGPIANLLPDESLPICVHLSTSEKISGEISPQFSLEIGFALAPTYAESSRPIYLSSAGST